MVRQRVDFNISPKGRRLIKEVRKAQESDKWLCKSHNATYDDVELPKKLVTRIFLVKAMYAKFVM